MPIEIPVVEQILSANDRIAAENRKLLDEHRVIAVNVMASPKCAGFFDETSSTETASFTISTDTGGEVLSMKLSSPVYSAVTE